MEWNGEHVRWTVLLHQPPMESRYPLVAHKQDAYVIVLHSTSQLELKGSLGPSPCRHVTRKTLTACICALTTLFDTGINC